MHFWVRVLGPAIFESCELVSAVFSFASVTMPRTRSPLFLSCQDTKNTHHLVQKYDDCLTAYHTVRMSLLKQKPKNQTAIW